MWGKSSPQHHLAMFHIPAGCPHNSILTLSTRLKPQSFEAFSPTPHASDVSCEPRLLPMLLIDWSEAPTAPSLSLINFLEQLSKLRELIYSLDHWFIMKGDNSGTARWKKCKGQGVGKGVRSFHGLHRCSTSQISTCFPTGKFFEPRPLGFHGGFIT